MRGNVFCIRTVERQLFAAFGAGSNVTRVETFSYHVDGRAAERLHEGDEGLVDQVVAVTPKRGVLRLRQDIHCGGCKEM